MRDGNFAKHPLTPAGWFTFGPTIGKPPRLACVASRHFFIARLRPIHTLSQTTLRYTSNCLNLPCQPSPFPPPALPRPAREA